MHRGVKWVVLDGPFTAGVQKEDLHLGNWYFLWAGRLHFIGSLLPCLCERRAEAMTWLGLLVDAVLGPRVSAFPVPCFSQKSFGYYNYCPNVGVIEESRFKSSERGNRSLPKLDVYVRLLPHEHGNRVFFFGGGEYICLYGLSISILISWFIFPRKTSEVTCVYQLLVLYILK